MSDSEPIDHFNALYDAFAPVTWRQTSWLGRADCGAGLVTFARYLIVENASNAAAGTTTIAGRMLQRLLDGDA